MVQTHGFRLRISSCSFFGIVYHGESYNQPPKKYSFLYNICQSSKVKHLIVAQVSGGTKGHIHHLSTIWCRKATILPTQIPVSVYMKRRRQPFGYPDICIAKKCLPCPARLKVGMLAFSNEHWSQNSGNVGMLDDVTRLQLEMQQNKYNVITQSCLGAWNLTT